MKQGHSQRVPLIVNDILAAAENGVITRVEVLDIAASLIASILRHLNGAQRKSMLRLIFSTIDDRLDIDDGHRADVAGHA